MAHWLNVHIWGPMWPNIFAPSAVTLTAIIISHMLHRRKMATHIDQLRQHVTAELERIHGRRTHDDQPVR